MKLEQEIKKRGGRLDLQALDRELRMSYLADIERCNSAIESAVANYPSVNFIEFDIIDDYTFNAFACLEDGKYFIGINRGVFATLRLIFDRIMADPSCLSFVGNVSKENGPLPLLNNLAMNFDFTVGDLMPFHHPLDRERHLYSIFMSALAIDFVLAHEIAHILNGHIDYYHSKLNIVHDEMSLLSGNKERMITKAIEMDADQNATLDLFLSELQKDSGKVPIQDFEKSLYGGSTDIFTRFSFVISVLFRIFGDQRLDAKLFVAQKYPSPRLRSLISILATPKLDTAEPKGINRPSIMGIYDIPKWAKNGYLMAESVLEKITGIPANQESVNDTWGSIGRDQINALYDFYNETLMDDLKLFAHRELFFKTM